MKTKRRLPRRQPHRSTAKIPRDTGAFTHKEGKWCPTLPGPDGTVIEIGMFNTREEAAAAYKMKHAELYPPAPPTKIHPTKHHVLPGAAPLVVSSPGIGEKPPEPAGQVHHLRHSWEAKRGQKSAFAPERKQQLQRELEGWLRQRPKRPKLDTAVWFVMEQLSVAETDIANSTIKTHIVRPVYARQKKRQ